MAYGNQSTIKVKMTRMDLCDLLLACTVVYAESDAEKWRDLHDKLMSELERIDLDHDYMSFKQ